MNFYVRILILLVLGVLLPCVAVLSIINYLTLAQYRENVSNSQIDQLRAVDSSNTLVVKNIEQGALRFSLEPMVQSLRDMTRLEFGPGNIEHLSSLLRATRMQTEFVSTNDLFESVYLYIEGGDYIISSRDSILKLDRFTDLGWLEKYQELREDSRAYRMMPAHPISTRYGISPEPDDSNRSCLTYVYPITPFTSTFHGALIFNIREDKLLELYLGDHGSSNVAIFNGNGDFLTSTGDIDYTHIIDESEWQNVFADESPENGHFYSGKNGTRLQYTYSWSADRRYLLLSVQDMNVLMEKITLFQFVFVVFLLLFIPFVALLVLAISRRLYSPVGKLVKELSAGGMIDLNMEKDALSAISKAVNELLREDQLLFSDQKREKLKDATTLRILAGSRNENDDEDIHAILPYSCNICIVCMLDTPIPRRRQDDNYNSRIRLLIRLIEKELADESMHPTAIQYDESTIVIILSVDESVNDLEQSLTARLKIIQPGAKAVMGETVTFAIGSLQEDLSGVRQCFEQAKTTIQYRFIFGLNSILFFDCINGRAGHYNADERMRYIQHCLDNSKQEDTLQGIDKLIGDIKATPDISYICVSQVLGQLVSMLAQYTIKNGILLEDFAEDNTPIYRRLWQNRTLDEAGAWLRDVFSAAIDYQNVGNSSSSEYMGTIIKYVHENYCGDITIDSIAAYIGLSYSYLRKLFKEATGQNLADYINNLRIQKAKQLFCETNYTVKIVSQMCGFNHERSFSRAFTQSEGVSPGKYKCLHKNAAQSPVSDIQQTNDTKGELK